jgi:prepilin-type N-terminal cleavage/methylation domain-containing protein
MKLKNIKNQKGFTIIEVLIVLAIAGLIMLVVFLAVPALQRNSRNTQRRADVSGVLGAISETVANKNGAPIDTDDLDTIRSNVKLGYYLSGNVTAEDGSNDVSNPGELETIVIAVGAKCSETDDQVDGSSEQGSSRGVAILFSVETGESTPSQQCQEG